MAMARRRRHKSVLEPLPSDIGARVLSWLSARELARWEQCGVACALRVGWAEMAVRARAVGLHAPLPPPRVGEGWSAVLRAIEEPWALGAGRNRSGELGLGHHNHVETLQPVRSLRCRPVRKLSCGGFHTLAIAREGSSGGGVLLACGSNMHGQCGFADPGDSDVFRVVDGPIGGGGVAPLCGACALDIAAGDRHSLAVESSTRCVLAFGANDQDQLGLGFEIRGASFPTPVPGVPAPAAAVFSGAAAKHSFAADVGGTVFAWGKNDHGQCCAPPTLYESWGCRVITPRPIALRGLAAEHLSQIASIVCGPDSTRMLTVRGRVLVNHVDCRENVHESEYEYYAKPFVQLSTQRCSAIAIAMERSYALCEGNVYCFIETAVQGRFRCAPILLAREIEQQRIVQLGATEAGCLYLLGSDGKVHSYEQGAGGDRLRWESSVEAVSTNSRRVHTLFAGGRHVFALTGVLDAADVAGGAGVAGGALGAGDGLSALS